MDWILEESSLVMGLGMLAADRRLIDVDEVIEKRLVTGLRDLFF